MSKSHVRFAQDTVLEPERIQVVAADGKTPIAEAHIGLLSVHHTYHAEIPFAHSLGSKVAIQTPEGNESVYALSISQTEKVAKPIKGNKYSNILTVEVKTKKDGLLQEKIQIHKEGRKNVLEVLITAKVLQSHQGNPLLKDGVRMISRDRDEEEASEWPGKGAGSDRDADADVDADNDTFEREHGDSVNGEEDAMENS